MLFSVVVPVYNVKEYLEDCINSILGQTYHDFEMILVNDGSTDTSGQICKNYAAKDKRVVYIEKKNGGLISARKAGVQVASGEYIVTVDSDDTVQKELLNKVQSIIENYNALDMICFNYYRMYNNKYFPQVIFDSNILYSRKQIIALFPNLIKGISGEYFNPNLWTKVIKTSLLKNLYKIIDERIKLGEDACITIPAIYGSHSMYCCTDFLYNYRYNPNSMTLSRKSGFPWQDVELRISYLKKCIPFEKYGFYDQICRDAVHALFNIAKSHFQAGATYLNIRKECIENFNQTYYKKYITDCKFKNNWKEQLALFCVKYKQIWLIALISKLEKLHRKGTKL